MKQLATTFRSFARLCMVGVALVAAQVTAGERLGVDFSSKPDAVGLGAFDVCMVRADARLDLEAVRAVRAEVLGVIELRDVAVGSEAERQAQELAVPLLESGKAGIARMDVTSPAWATVAARTLARRAAERGFSGFVLAGLDTLRGDAERAAGLELLAVLRGMYPEKTLVLKDAFALVAEARRHLDGVLITDGGQTDEQVREAVRLGLKAYVVETGVAVEKIAARAQAIEALGGVPFFTTPALDGVNLGPMREVTRRVAVLHSGAARDTFTATVLHGSLQWLGYEVRYHEFNAEVEVGNDAAGVILDRNLNLTAAEQESLTALVKKLAQQKVRLLITGMPWDDAGAVADVLGWQGSGAKPALPERPAFAKLEGAALMQNGMVTPRTEDFRDLRAPANARVLMSLRVGKEKRITFDQAYLTDWGALWFDSLAPQVGPQISPMFMAEQWLAGAGDAPVLDVTSQNGKRLMVTHIGAEGFTEISSTKGLPLAAEAMLERVLKRHEVPCTVAICEGDVRGWTPASDARETLRYAQVARSILALPHVEAASASLSRPNNWRGKGYEAGPLDMPATAGRLSVEREIAGSLTYIHRQLLPFGRSVGLMLWPRNAAPDAAAVAFARKMGVESFEQAGSLSLPGSMNPVPPVSWHGGPSLQVTAANHRHETRLNAGELIAEFDRTGAGAWQTPVHVGLTFEDAQSERSLSEVDKLFTWCRSQPLHAVTAGDYARMVSDAAQTRLFEAGPRHWVLVNRGRAQTLRLPASAGVPDLGKSFGISSYTVRAGCLYVHTVGGRRTELVLKTEIRAAQPISPAHARLR
jgi:hypothetical protein